MILLPFYFFKYTFVGIIPMLRKVYFLLTSHQVGEKLRLVFYIKLTQLICFDIIMEETMKRIITLINMWSCTIWGIFIVLLCFKGVLSMEWWQTILVAIIPAAISSAVTWYINRKSQINSNTYQISKLIERLGIKEDKTLHADISDKFDSIISDIGRNENSSLTKQHSEMKEMLVTEIELSERRYKDEEGRIRNFTLEQHNINKSLEEFKLFMESWKRMAEQVNKQELTIAELQTENKVLKDKFSKMTENNVSEDNDEEQIM